MNMKNVFSIVLDVCLSVRSKAAYNGLRDCCTAAGSVTTLFEKTSKTTCTDTNSSSKYYF